MSEPTNEQIGAMASAAISAAMDKAKELDLPFIYGLAGIERAYESSIRLAMLVEVLGPENTVEIGKELMKAQAYDLQNEAEEVLRNGD